MAEYLFCIFILQTSSPMKNKNIHVAHLSSVHQADDLRIFTKEACSLAKAGFKVSLVAQAEKDERKRDVSIYHLHRVAKRRHRIFRLWDIWRMVRQLKPKLIHLHDPELLLLAPFMKQRFSIPVIFDAHEIVAKDIRSKYWLPVWLRPVLANIYSILERVLFTWIDGLVIVADRFVADYAAFPQNRIAVVRNYPVFAETAAIKNAKNRAKLIYVGRPTPIRGVEEMIRALSMVVHYNSVLELIGPVDEVYKRELSKLIGKYNLADRVKITVTTDQEHISRALQEAQIGLVLNYPVPNHLDSLPTKAFTYMMNRLPLIASDIPIWKNVIEKVGCG
ncbi:MAG TPA: glycosyltransferase, partial [Bacteroidetes bacterium]|nr:glycosyltransferase [Bacteroidota bacterium]